MATAQENLARFQEISNRGLQDKLDPDKRARFDEAVKRGLVKTAPEKSGVQKYVTDPFNEAVSAVNRGVVNTIDFLGSPITYAAGAIQEGTLNPKSGPTLRGALKDTPLSVEGNFMEDGVVKDVIRKAGEVVAPGVVGGQVLRQAAQQLPALTAQTEGVLPGILRTVGKSTAVQDATLSAASGGGSVVGGEVGEAVGGKTGRQVGEFTGALLAPVAAATLASKATAAKQAPPDAEAIAAEKATGIRLLPAQKSKDPVQLRAQRFLPELSVTSQRAADSLSTQNKEVATAVDDFIKILGPDDSIVNSGERFRNAAQRAMESAKQVRSEKASPFYKKAFSEAVDVDVAPVKTAIQSVRANFPESGGVSKSLGRVEKMLGDKPSLQRLHNTKLQIDDMLSAFGEGSLGNTAKRELRGVKQLLVDQMEAASPTYREARLAFERESPFVNKLQESIIGKIADFDDTQLKNISRKVFDPSQTDPRVVQNAKTIIDDVDPDAWNRLLRAEVERRVGSIKPEIGVAFENVPSKQANAIFGTGKNREAILSGMSPQQRQHAEFLETALTRAGLGRPGGSETAGRQQFIKELDSGLLSAARNFLKNPVDRALSTGEGAVFNKRAKAMADALFDPEWTPEVTKAMKDKSGRSLGYLFYLVNDSIENANKRKEQQQPEIQQAPVQQAAQ
jgi:hypothetical protein